VTGVSDAAARIEDAGRVVPTCPKRMVYGPCGGVRAGGGCEVDERPCPFVTAEVVRWVGPPAAGGRQLTDVLGAGRPIIVTDLRVRPFDRRSMEAVTARLAVDADAVLVGEHHTRPDFPPTTMAAAVQAAGGRPWVTLTCRDRNPVVLESELAGLVDAGVGGSTA